MCGPGGTLAATLATDAMRCRAGWRRRVIHPCERIQQPDTGEDHQGAQDDGSNDSEKKNAPLLRRHQSKGAEQHQKDEKIVDAERFLNSIAGQIFQRVLLRQNGVDQQREEQGRRYP